MDTKKKKKKNTPLESVRNFEKGGLEEEAAAGDFLLVIYLPV